MDSTAAVSILIPAFNHRRWIAAAIESALAQTWPDKEIIVVDDASTDDTAAIARGYASRGVSVISLERHQGAAAARNRGLAASRGDFIQWLDADDLLAPDKIERQMLDAGQADRRTLLSAAWGRFIHRPYRAEFAPSGLWRDQSAVEWLICKLRDNAFMQTATWLVPRELAEAAGPWDTQLTADDDGEYFCRVLMASDGVRFVPGSRVFYRRAGRDRLSRIGLSEEKITSQFRSARLHVHYLLSLEDSARTRAACLIYLQSNLMYAYPERPELVEQMQELAASLGGRLTPPTLPRKYRAVQALFGMRAAKYLQSVGQPLRASVVGMADRAGLMWDRLRGGRGSDPSPGLHSLDKPNDP